MYYYIVSVFLSRESLGKYTIEPTSWGIKAGLIPLVVDHPAHHQFDQMAGKYQG